MTSKSGRVWTPARFSGGWPAAGAGAKPVAGCAIARLHHLDVSLDQSNWARNSPKDCRQVADAQQLHGSSRPFGITGRSALAAAASISGIGKSRDRMNIGADDDVGS